MKVMCIKEDTMSVNYPFLRSLLEAGEYYTVTGIHEQDYYWILEIPLDEFGYPVVFHKTNFGLLSSIDETEMVREQQNVSV